MVRTRRIAFEKRCILLAAVACVTLYAAGPLADGPAAARAAAQQHDHEEDHEHGGWIGFLGSLHPVAVHFPIALVMVAGLAEVLYWVRRRKSYASVVLFTLSVAAVSAIAAAALGFAAASVESYDGVQQRNFSAHRVLGIVSPVLIVLTLGLSESARRTGAAWQVIIYRVLLLATMIVVGVAGYFGGLLVFGPEHFTF